MRLAVEPAPNGGWRVMLAGSDAPVSAHDTEEEAREALGAYVRGSMDAERRRASSERQGDAGSGS